MNSDLNIKLNFDDPLAVQQRWNELLHIAKERELTAEETAEAVQCTRVLRRTHTGPAKAKTSTARATKSAKLDTLKNSLLDD